MLNTEITQENHSNSKNNETNEGSIISMVDRKKNKTVQFDLRQDIDSNNSNQSSDVKDLSIKGVHYLVDKMDKNSDYFNKIYHNGYDQFEEELDNIDPYEETNQYKSASFAKDDLFFDQENIFEDLNKELNVRNDKSTGKNLYPHVSEFDIKKIQKNEAMNLVEYDDSDLNNDNINNHIIVNRITGTFNPHSNDLQVSFKKTQKKDSTESDLPTHKLRKK